MVAGTPLTGITLGAASVADDLGYVALADLARALGAITEDYRVIGGHTTEVPGLQQALARPPIIIALELRRLNGEVLQCEVPFADEVSALVLKGLATRVRSKDTDIVDTWRCLEIAFAAGVGPQDFAGGVRAESAEVIRSLFSNRRSAPLAALTSGQRFSAEAADARLTRIRALIARVLGPE